MIRIEGDRNALYQWDLNQRIILTNIKPGIQVHFYDEHKTFESCPIVIAYEENGNVYADIPNLFLQKNGIITIYIYVENENKAYTEYHSELLVLYRPKPADYVYTETEVKTWEVLEKKFEEIEEKLNMEDEWYKTVEKLAKWYDDEHYIPLAIDNFSMSPSNTTYEIGSKQNIKFSWSFNKLPIEIKFNEVAQELSQSGSSTIQVTGGSHSTLTFKLYGKYKESETISQLLSIYFRNKYYYGCKPIPTNIDDEFIKSLSSSGSSGWANAKTISFTPNCISGTYVWYAYPKRFGPASMWAGGFEGGFEEPLVIPVKNSSGYIEDYYIYRSINSGIGNSTIQAK